MENLGLQVAAVAAEKAFAWLKRHHGEAASAAIDAMLHDGLGEAERRALAGVEPAVAERIERNAAEWLLAEGRIAVRGVERAVAERVLVDGGPLLEASERAWVEQLATRPLRLYEIVAVSPEGRVSVRDALEAVAPVIETNFDGQALSPGRRVGLRLLTLGGRTVPSDAVYEFSPPAGEGVLAQLREAAGQFGDLPEMQGVLIRYCWLAQYHESAGRTAIDPFATDGCASGACGCAGARAAQAGDGCGDDIERQLAAAFNSGKREGNRDDAG